MLIRTPFYQAHVQSGAKLIDFGGFEMPVQYEGIKAEHQAVREAVGMFDVSHMGEVLISGPDALAFIQSFTINDASKLSPGRAQYSAMCYENGGIVDDLLVYMLAENEYMLVINASNIQKDVEWMTTHLKGNVTLKNVSDETCLLAIQGPKSIEVVQKLTSVDVASIGYYRFAQGDFAGMQNVLISETGYTGEKGFEIYFKNEGIDAVHVWNTIMEAGAECGIKPAGLGARDTLRLEMGFALYGNDISKDTNPLEAGLGWITKFDKPDFVAKSILEVIKAEGVKKRLIGFVVDEEKAMPRAHYPLCDASGNQVGEVTSGGLSITNGAGIGMGYCDVNYAKENQTIYISIRGKLVKATLTKPPFIKKKE